MANTQKRRKNLVRYLALLSLVIFPQFGFSLEKKVIVIGTVHGDHNRFPLYTFQTIEILLKHIDPDILLIEEDPKTFTEKWYEGKSEDEYNKSFFERAKLYTVSE